MVSPVSSEGGSFRRKKTLRKFWYTGACCEPGCTLFPPPPGFWRSLFGKMRNRAGITQRCPAGMDEVIFSNVTKTRSGWGWGLGGRWHRQGVELASTGNPMKIFCACGRTIEICQHEC